MARGFRLQARGDGDLKRRYRPQTLKEIVPTFPIRSVKQIVTDPNAPQVYLFEGLTGSGKTTCARIISRASICEGAGKNLPCMACSRCENMERSGEYLEVNVANFRGIDAIRSIVDGMATRPNYQKRKIYVFDEVHQLTPAAQEMLLKVLEEPPPEVLIFLLTTKREGLSRTLLGRTHPITFKRMTRAHSDKVIDQILEDHGIEPPSDEIRNDLFQRADGSVRDLLTSLQLYINDEYTLAAEDDGEARADVKTAALAMMEQDWETVRQMLQSATVRQSPESFRIGLVNYLRGCCLRAKTISGAQKAAFPLGQLAGTLSKDAGDIPIEKYNVLVLRCMRACYGRK